MRYYNDLFFMVELIYTRELTNTAKHRLTQTDTGLSISWTGLELIDTQTT
jgi:hypothetical protein